MAQSYPNSTIWHSASHILAQAVLREFPDAKLGIGPAIDEGFYYDFELPRSLTPDDLKILESTMAKIVDEDQLFTCTTVTRDAAMDTMAASGQPYKLEIIRDLDLDAYTFYQNGPFTDLCRGPHVNTTGQVGKIKLLKISGAYWRGDEKNPMLQRIYGIAFPTEAEIADHLKKLEEAKKRDHRVLGKQLNLFSIQDEIGGGLVLWHPKGGRLRTIIENFWREQHYESGYELVYTPHVGRSNLWETSGHLGFYKDSMFAPMTIEDQDYFIRPMNCPFHIQIVQSTPLSYRDLPIRMAELGTVYRYERSGVLHGLMRVRGFTQDDAHIVCTRDQVSREIMTVVQFCLNMLRKFGFERFDVYVSTRPIGKSVGDDRLWAEAESALIAACDALNLPYQIDHGGGAFYGPKIDIKIEDAIGRKWQCSTVQFDFNLPERFNMTYVGSDGNRHQPIMIHRALLGSLERFLGVLIEHYAGKFPVWLSPVQLKILTVSDTVFSYAKSIEAQLKSAGIRVELDDSNEKIGYKIRQAAIEQVPFMGIIGQREVDEHRVTIRARGGQDLGSMALTEVIRHVV